MEEKNKQRDTNEAFHFVIDLPLDTVVERLMALKSMPPIGGLRRISDDLVRFRLESQSNGETVAFVTGTAQRWEGTETRVDIEQADITSWLANVSKPSSSKPTRITPSMVFALIGIGFIASLLLPISPAMAMLIIFIIVVLRYFFQERSADNPNPNWERIAYRDLDRLVAKLSHTLRAPMTSHEQYGDHTITNTMQ